MTDYPLVSIVIPVYNGSNYLREAIVSALSQTYPNIEVIVINDGSTDNGLTRDVALSYGDRIRYFEKKNGGVASALNKGIDEMKGEYLSWLSHDDIYYPDKIEKQIKALSQKNDYFGIVYCRNQYLINEKIMRNSCADSFTDVKRNGYYALLFNFIHGCTLLIPKKCLDTVGGFKEELDTTNDYELFFRLAKHYKFIFVNKNLVKVRIHQNQDSVTKLSAHFKECNRLWIDTIESMTKSEILCIEKTRYIFYRKLVNFLRLTHYSEAYDFVKDKSTSCYMENSLLNFIFTRIPIISGIYCRNNWYRKCIKWFFEIIY